MPENSVKLKDEKQRWKLQSGRHQCLGHPFESPASMAIHETPVIQGQLNKPAATSHISAEFLAVEKANPPSHQAVKYLQGESMAAVVVSLVWCQLGPWKTDFSDGRHWAALIQAKPAENQPRKMRSKVWVQGNWLLQAFRRSCLGFGPLLCGLLSYRRTGNPLLSSLGVLPGDLFIINIILTSLGISKTLL